MSFADNLKQIRKEHHLSQEELAEILDVRSELKGAKLLKSFTKYKNKS